MKTYCWEHRPGRTCSLPEGHREPCRFVPDTEIVLTLTDAWEEELAAVVVIEPE